jgi:hypothetical protein
VRIAIVFCVLAVLLGGVQVAQSVASAPRGSAVSEAQRRDQSWSRSHGFGLACAPTLPAAAEVLLVNPMRGPGEPFINVTWDADVSHFAYPLRPRVVELDWDLSGAWSPPAGAKFVAVWEQADLRTPAQQAAAAQIVDTLHADPGSASICSYTNSHGDRGTIFDVASHTAAPAASASPIESPLPTPYGSLQATALAYAGLLGLWLIGLLLLATVCPGKLSTPLRLAIALPIGCALVAVQLTSYSLVNIPWSRFSVLVPWAILAGAFFLYRRPRPALWKLRGPAPLDGGGLGVLLGLCVVLFALAPFGISVQDGFSGAYFKAANFWEHGSLLSLYEHARVLEYTHPAHPPLLPLTVDWLYLWVGGVDEHATLILWPAFMCCILGTLYALIRPATSSRLALWSTLGFAVAVPEVFKATQFYGYADVPLAAFLLCGVGLLTLANRNSVRVTFVAGILLGGAAWTKEEGIIAGPVALALVAFLALRSRSVETQAWWQPSLALALGWFLMFAPLLVLKISYPTPTLILQARTLDEIIERLPVVTVGFGLRAVKYWLLPLGLLALAVWQLARSGRLVPSLGLTQILLPAAFVLVQLAADVAAVTLNPQPAEGELSWAAGRLLVQLAPLVYLAAVSACAVAFGAVPARRRSMQEEPAPLRLVEAGS